MTELTGCGKPGEKLTLNKAIKDAHESLLMLPHDQWKQINNSNAGELFHAVDTNSDGIISADEFAVLFMAVGLSREESKRSFDIIDTVMIARTILSDSWIQIHLSSNSTTKCIQHMHKN